MPSYKSVEIDCPVDGVRDQLVERAFADLAETRCDKCGEMAELLFSAPLVQTVNPRNSDFAARQSARIDKRNTEAWNKGGKDQGVERSRAIMKKSTAG